MKKQRVEYYSPESFQNVNNEGDCNYQCDHTLRTIVLKIGTIKVLNL